MKPNMNLNDTRSLGKLTERELDAAIEDKLFNLPVSPAPYQPPVSIPVGRVARLLRGFEHWCKRFGAKR